MNDDLSRTIDWDAYVSHIDFICRGGLAAIVVAGGTGEMFSLTSSEITELIRVGIETSKRRLPVLAGVGFGPAMGCELARTARDLGVDGLVVLPPYYASPDDRGLTDYYLSIATSVPDIAVIPYSRGHARVTPDVLRGLTAAPNIVAVKDGQGDLRMFLRNRLALGSRFIWVAGTGDDLVGAYAAAGAQAYTSSIACFDPGLSVQLWRLANSGAHEALDSLLASHVLPWYELRARRPGYEVAVMKAAMEAFGQRAGPVRAPLVNLSAAEKDEVQRLASRLGTWHPLEQRSERAAH
jgi:5-dehydro-4-deoxyglucarate dehydratase